MSIGELLKYEGRRWRDLGGLLDLGFVYWCGTSGGSSNAYTLTPNPKINNYKDGAQFRFIADRTNTSGGTTLNISSRGDKTVVYDTSSTALAGGEIIAGNIYTVVYIASIDDFILVDPSPAWIDWTPTYAEGGGTGGTWDNGAGGDPTLSWAKYAYDYNTDVMHITVKALGHITGGTLTHFLLGNLPATFIDQQAIGASVHDGGSIPEGGIAVTDSGGNIQVWKYDKSAMAAGTSNKGVNFTATFRLA